jgi:3'-5' exoribonuclease
MAETLLKAAEFYPNANKDLLVTGALLHDIGKIQEYTWDVTIEYSDKGRLIGHIVLGQELLNERRKLDTDMPDELWEQVIHMVLSHQGTHEQKSPILPMTLEAVMLYCADMMDSRANAYDRIIQRSREQGDRWSEWVNLADTFLFTGFEEDKSEPPPEDTLF